MFLLSIFNPWGEIKRLRSSLYEAVDKVQRAKESLVIHRAQVDYLEGQLKALESKAVKPDYKPTRKAAK